MIYLHTCGSSESQTLIKEATKIFKGPHISEIVSERRAKACIDIYIYIYLYR